MQLTGSEIVIECDRRADVQAEREVPVGYFVIAVLFDDGSLIAQIACVEHDADVVGRSEFEVEG